MTPVMPAPPVVLDALPEICARYGIARLDVFGSVVRGDAREDSDVDVLYEMEPGRHLTWDIQLLVDELSAALGRRVDLVSRRYLHRRLRDGIEAEARPLYVA